MLLVAAYLMGLAERLAVNPNDKLLPPRRRRCRAPSSMALGAGPALRRLPVLDRHGSSLVRLADRHRLRDARGGLVLGVAIGLVPRVPAALGPFVAVLSVVPPLALLPILFIVFGLGEPRRSC